MTTPDLRDITRRHFFKQSGFGIGGVALSALLDDRLFAQQQADGPFGVRAPHFAPKAKNIIYLFMAGAPSQLDLFDNKPTLQKYDGQEIPAEFVPKGERFAFIKGTPRLLGSPFTFKKYGQRGRRAVGAAAAPGDDRRRHRHRPLDAHRRSSTTRRARSS